jgi:flavin reductase ActVB
MPITSEDFRHALSHFAAGVTITTIRAGDRIHGLTVSAFASVSAAPPLITVVIDNRHRAKELFEEEGAVFAVNVLRHDQSELSNRFAWVKDENRFAEGNWGTAVTGAPVLADALAWLDCTVHSRFAAGTHTIYVGEVQASQVPESGAAPLLYWNRGYRQLQLSEDSIHAHRHPGPITRTRSRASPASPGSPATRSPSSTTRSWTSMSWPSGSHPPRSWSSSASARGSPRSCWRSSRACG